VYALKYLPATNQADIFILEDYSPMNGIGTVAFLITFLFLVFSLVVLVVSLVRGQTRRAWRWGSLLISWMVVYTLILLGVSLTSQAPTLEAGQEHCFDEMCFSMQHLTRTSTLAANRANGVYYIVDVRLRNAARRTAQKPSNPQIWVVDAQGQAYRQMVSADPGRTGQPATGSQLWGQRISPGEAADRLIAFDLPESISSPALVITEGSGFPTDVIIGDENSFLHPKTIFRMVK
jgi:hypothetical protein